MRPSVSFGSLRMAKGYYCDGCRSCSEHVTAPWRRPSPMAREPVRMRRLFCRASAALVFMGMTLFVSRAHAQASSPTGAQSGTRPVGDGVARELLREIQEQQKRLDEKQKKLAELQKSIDDEQKSLTTLIRKLEGLVAGSTPTIASIDAQRMAPSTAPDASASGASPALNTVRAVTASAGTPAPSASFATPQTDNNRYRDGIVIWETSEHAKVPFLLKFNVNTQIRYLNTLDSKETFTDHLGVVRDVNTRNDITVNRSMFILGGYIFDRRLLYSVTVWTSAGAASIVVAGNIGWRFNKALTLTGGYTGIPGSRSLVNTFPFFTASDRSMADNFFRPGFTQGVWASGQPVKGLNYLAFLGNGLNTLNISATKIDTHLMFSGSVWWEPLGAYGGIGKSVNMYDDYFASKK